MGVSFTPANGKRCFLETKDLARRVYRVAALLRVDTVGGQGDVEFSYTYLCRDTEGKYLMVKETYDVSWWDPVGGLSEKHLYDIEEAAVSEADLPWYKQEAVSALDETVALPITIALQRRGIRV